MCVAETICESYGLLSFDSDTGARGFEKVKGPVNQAG